jgi:prophage DNA circulation protein
MPFGVEQVLDALGLGSETWQDRLATHIELTSPSGIGFEAAWQKDDRSKDKKLATYFYPFVKGNVVRDLGINSTIYPLTFFFSGDNNDKQAALFFETCSEDGLWVVSHPVHGVMELQLMTVREINSPLDEGNITRFETQWIEPIDEDTLQTARELAGLVDALRDDLDASSMNQFDQASAFDTFSKVAGTINAIQSAVEKSLDTLQFLASSTDDVAKAFTESLRDLANTFDQLTPFGGPSAEVVAGITQAIFELPCFGLNEVATRMSAYQDVMTGLLSALPGNDLDFGGWFDGETKNAVASVELCATACLAAVCLSVTTGKLETRSQAVITAQAVGDLFASMTSALDSAQTAFADQPIQDQFFSQSSAFTDAMKITATAMRFLLVNAFDLKIEKRFTLDRPRAVAEIVYAEYGTLGENDENYDLFIAANQLKALDILWLPEGREVVVYA